MKSFPKRIALVACVLVLGAAYSMATRPSVVVTVDLAKVVDNLDQRGRASASLSTMTEKYKAEKDGYEVKLKELQEKLKQLVNEPDTPDRRATQNEFMQLTFDYEATMRFITAKLDVERSLLMRDLYRSVKTSVKAMAEAEGYDIVIVDDSQGDLIASDETRLSREAQIRQQIAARRVLYSAPVVDVTDQLIVRMNNEFNAGPVAAVKPEPQ